MLGLRLGLIYIRLGLGLRLGRVRVRVGVRNRVRVGYPDPNTKREEQKKNNTDDTDRHECSHLLHLGVLKRENALYDHWTTPSPTARKPEKGPPTNRLFVKFSLVLCCFVLSGLVFIFEAIARERCIGLLKCLDLACLALPCLSAVPCLGFIVLFAPALSVCIASPCLLLPWYIALPCLTLPSLAWCLALPWVGVWVWVVLL